MNSNISSLSISRNIRNNILKETDYLMLPDVYEILTE